MLFKRKLSHYKSIIKILCIFSVVLFFYKTSHQLIEVKIISPLLILPAALFTILLLLVHGFQSKYIFSLVQCQISFLSAISGALINSLGNSVFSFMAGMISSAVYFKKVVLVDYSKALMVHGLSFLLTAWTLLITFWAINITENYNYAILIWLTAAIIIVVFPFCMAKLSNRYKQLFPKYRKLYYIPTFNLNRMSYLIVISTIYVSVFSSTLTYWCYLNALGHEISLKNIFQLSVISFVSSLFSVLPFSFGLREICFAAFANLIDSTVGPFVAASLLDRAVSLILNFLLSLCIFTKFNFTRRK